MLLPMIFIAFLASLISVKGSSVQMNASCGFHLTTTGAYNGSVGQLGNGQVRAGSDLSPSLFTWFGDAFADQQGRGCWWTPPSSVLQCDWNQQPSHGFGIGCYGGVSYRDQSEFYECHTGDGDEVNLYLEPISVGCSTIMIHSDSCRPPCAGESSSPSPSLSPSPSPSPTGTATSGPPTPTPFQTISSSSQASSATPTPTPPSGECDKVVAEGPDEIILIDKANPYTAYGPNSDMIVQLSPNASAIFVFRFAASDLGKECGLAFDLPSANAPPYKLTGGGLVSFALLDGPPADPGGTSWNNAPGVAMPLEAVLLQPGASAQPLSFPCPGADAEVAFMMRDVPGSDTCLEYDQLRPDVPIGLYLVKC
ncbi:hypothetical protein F4804DRAFT_110749 [Jackrogersella minutella]|nr:hypothetical protein F4804DRAFT_110749 [Jackrogersella minutella]